MTVQEVKESIEYLKMQLTEDLEMICFTGDELKALDMSIQALEEVEQYRSLGTVEELKEAREKQVAKKPIKNNPIINNFWSDDSMLCPICHNYVGTLFRDTYCCYCGQILTKEGGTSD